MTICSIISMHFNIEFVGCVSLVLDVNSTFLYIHFSCFYCLWSTIFQYFEPIGRFSDSCSKRDSNRQSDHACARNTHAHSIFQDIRTEQHFDTIGAGAKFLGSSCYSQSYADRFGASHRRNDLLFDKCDNLLSLLVCQGGILCVFAIHTIISLSIKGRRYYISIYCSAISMSLFSAGAAPEANADCLNSRGVMLYFLWKAT